MNTFEQSAYETDLILTAHYTDRNTVESINLPETQYADNGDRDAVPYVATGEADAPNVLLTYSPYLTPIGADHMKVRLDAQQAVLGQNWRVIGVEGFTPSKGAFNAADRRTIARGDFSPMAARGLRVAEQEGVQNAKRVAVAGYSLAGDLATQTAANVAFGESRGIFELKALSTAEAARTELRGSIAVFGAFGASGKDLFKNITESKSSALLEAWGIDPNDPKAEKKMMGQVNKGAMGYMLGGRGAIKANLALAHGFAGNRTELQINDLVQNTDTLVIASRHEESKICTAALFARLRAANPNAANLELLTLPGDHSSDDNISTSAARVRYLVQHLVAKQ